MCMCLHLGNDHISLRQPSKSHIKYFNLMLQSQHQNIAVIHLLAAEKHHTDKWVYSQNAT